MRTGRLEAFSDGVIAIIITIMVLEMKVPHGDGPNDLLPVLPVFLSYILSFVYVGIYWNNHHHMLHATRRVTGGILWANLHLLFWLSLFPFATGWMGENHFSPLPTALYGVVLLMAAIAYYLLQQVIIRSQGPTAFGGDPARVTVAGESAGSISVSALMASPLSKNLMAAAIGESGAMISSLPPQPLAAAEENGVKFGTAAGATTLAALRGMTAEQIQEATTKVRGVRFGTTLDGYFLPKPLAEIFEAGEQAKIPLLAGSNTQEQSARSILGEGDATPENFANAVKRLYGDHADSILRAYSANTPDEVYEAATQLASARFIAHSTWKWTELQMKTGGKPVYRYLYARPRPKYLGMPGDPAPAASASGQPAQRPSGPQGAVHSAEIQYAMGNLDLDKRYTWEPADYEVSKVMQAYFVNFIKTGNPNGPGLPEWPAYTADDHYQRMRIDVKSQAGPEGDRARYLALDEAAAKR